MMEVIFSSSFEKSFKKRIKGRKEVEKRFWKIVDCFIIDLFTPSLKTHKLEGKLNKWWSFSIEYDLRVIFAFKKNNQEAVFIDIGSHDEVY